jgi:hypothetical protein
MHAITIDIFVRAILVDEVITDTNASYDVATSWVLKVETKLAQVVRSEPAVHYKYISRFNIVNEICGKAEE